jgi:hypothetical protein
MAIIAEVCLDFLPAMVHEAGTRMEKSREEFMIVEIPDQWGESRVYSIESGWKKQYTWLELVRWLGRRARKK